MNKIYPGRVSTHISVKHRVEINSKLCLKTSESIINNTGL